MVADIRNCRVLIVDRAHRIVHSYGSPARCYHHPPDSFSSPNGATPLPDGGVLITEIGGWIDRLDRNGNLVYTVRTPTTYPSDAQLLPDGDLLVAGFNTPGRVDILSRTGDDQVDVRASIRPRVTRPPLPRCPLAERHDRRHRRLAPQDRRDRPEDTTDRLAIRPLRHRLLRGRLPLQAGRSRPPARSRRARGRTGHRHEGRPPPPPEPSPRLAPRPPTSPCGSSGTSRPLPPASRRSRCQTEKSPCSAVSPPPAHPTRFSSGNHQRCATSAPCQWRPTTPPQPLLGHQVFLFGGGQTTSFDAIDRLDPTTGTVKHAGTIGEPLSDLGAATIGSTVFLVGGYTGTTWATAIQRFVPGHTPTVVGRLPAGLRYAGVAVPREPHLHSWRNHHRRYQLNDPLLRPLPRHRPTDRRPPSSRCSRRPRRARPIALPDRRHQRRWHTRSRQLSASTRAPARAPPAGSLPHLLADAGSGCTRWNDRRDRRQDPPTQPPTFSRFDPRQPREPPGAGAGRSRLMNRSRRSTRIARRQST